MADISSAPKLRPRTYSDPELPQLLPLPVRPSSSYEARPKALVPPKFDEMVFQAMATKLGLSIQKNAEFRWIVKDCLMSLAADGWQSKLRGEEDIEFVNKVGEIRSDHPLFALHKTLADHLRHTHEDYEDKLKDPHFLVKQLVFKAIMGEKDVRGVCEPKMMHEILQHLDVDEKEEPYLIRRVKYTVEDSYFRMKKEGAHRINVDNCIDLQSLIVNLELDRVGFMKKIAEPSRLLYCCNCSTALGDVISTGGHDVLCNACAVEMHSTGHRQDHPIVFIEQTVCSECQKSAALVRCQDCVDLFCYECFKDTHKRGKRQRHCVGLPTRTFCFECDSREAAYVCNECMDALCVRCSSRIHRSGARQNHHLFGLRKAAYNKKLFGDNLDLLMGIIQNNLERSYDLNPWFVFYDASLAPYWYNFGTRFQMGADPNSLQTPPVESDGHAADAPAHELTPDEQIERGLPGAADVRNTHYAKYAAHAAVFEVPPPVHIRFASPVSTMKGAGGRAEFTAD